MVHVERDRDIYVGRLFLLLTFTPIICLFFWRIGLNPGSVQDRIGIIYQGVFTPPYICIANSILFCKYLITVILPLQLYKPWLPFTIKDLEQGWLAQCQFNVTGWGIMFI